MENKDDALLITVEQFAKRTGLSLSSAYKIARSADFTPGKRISGRLLVSVKLLDAWIEQQSNQKGE